MKSNKNIPNPKNNLAQTSPWLLCPSKSFPGRFYYFNGSTGETAWSLSETDKNLKKGPIRRVTDKAHTYPEPFDPPDDSPNTSNSFSSLKNPSHTDFTHIQRPSPIFGQAVFPKYVPTDIYEPKFVWALTPMFMPSQMPPRKMLDQMTQTFEPTPMFVHADQFQPLKRPLISAQSTPFHLKKPIFDKANFAKKSTFAKPQMKDEACQTFVPRFQRIRTKSESDVTPKSSLKASRSVENLTLMKDVETSTLNLLHKVENVNEESQKNVNDKLNELAENDLRFKLVAKKKKECTVTGDNADKSDQSKTTKTQEVLQKKKVTFDIQAPGTSHSDPEDLPVNIQTPDSSPTNEGSYWFVVADTEALLSGLQCIEEIVKNDPTCRLLIPHAVYTELESRSRGDSGAICARKLLRKLSSHDNDNYIIVQSKPEYDLPTEDAILECCWGLIQGDCHVILIANNTNTSHKAKSINLECYTVEEIKLGNEPDPMPLNDLSTLNITVNNDNKKSTGVANDTSNSENLFMQDLEQINGLYLTRPNGLTVRPKINIFNDNLFSKTDSSSDKLIDLTRPKNLAEATIDFNPEKHKHNINAKYNISNINQNQKSVPNNIEIIDEIDIDIRRLNLVEQNQENCRDSIKVSGITKLNKPFNLDDELERFYVKSSVMESRIISRIDEWICRLNQAMEEALTDLLLNEKVKVKRMTPPWNLFEAIQVVGEAYKMHNNIKLIVAKFSMTLLSSSSNNGKIKQDLKPGDFLKLVGLSLILIENLKEIVNCKELHEANERLNNLIKNIEDPKTDIDLSLDKINTPMFSRSDIIDSKTPIGFRKSRTEILEYLSKHFEAWQSGDTQETADNIGKEPNILITCGKNLNTLKINNTRTITVEKNPEQTVDNAKLAKERNNEKPVLNNQPKVIRNVQIIEAFEERMKNRAQLDLDDLDYEDNESEYTISDNTKFKHPDSPEHNFVLEDLSVSESSADTECVRAYPLAKIFLIKLKGTLIRIHNFINSSIHEYQEGISIDKKADMRFKTILARQYLHKIAGRLKNIIERESSNGMTLKHILIKAGDYVEDDGLMANYKETVTKFLHQTEILAGILEHLLPLSNAASPKENDTTTPSPILPTSLRKT